MAQEVTSRDFKLFIEEQKRTNEQLLLLKEKSGEETKNTLLVGELLKQIKQGDDEESTPQGYIKAALPEILSDVQNTTREITSTKTELDEQDTLFKTTNSILTTQNSAIAQQTSTFSDILKTLQDTQLVLQYIYATGTKQISVQEADLAFQKQLEFRAEREEARGDDEPPTAILKEEDDDKKKGGFFAALGPLRALLTGAVSILAGLYTFAIALKDPEFKKQTKETFEALGDAFDAMKSLFVTIGPAVAYIAKFSFQALEVAFKGLESMFVNLQDFIDNGPNPETYEGLPMTATVANKSATTTATTLSTYLTRLKTSFMAMDLDIVKTFKPLGDVLSKTGTAILKAPVIAQILGVFGKTGSFLSVLGKAAWPLTIIQGVYEFFTGYINTWEQTEGEPYYKRVLISLDKAVYDVVDALVYAPIDFMTQAFGWMLGKMGIKDENNENFLKDYSIENALNELTLSTTNFINDMINGAVSKVTQIWDDFMTWWDSWDITSLLPDWAKIFVNDAEPLSTEPGKTGDTFEYLSDPVSGFRGGSEELRDILDEAYGDVDVPESSTGTIQTGETLEEIALANSNLTKQQLDNIKALMNNNELLLDEMKNNQGGVNVVSGGNSINTYAKSDLTLSKSARPDDFSYNLLMASV